LVQKNFRARSLHSQYSCFEDSCRPPGPPPGRCVGRTKKTRSAFFDGGGASFESLQRKNDASRLARPSHVVGGLQNSTASTLE
jgi:hypothetical protein